MYNFTVIILAALLVPYFVWGIYALQLRYLRHYDWPMHIEAASLGALMLFYAMAFPVLRLYLSETPAAMMFAMLGLLASGFALYGHMAISLTAKLVVDSVTHSGEVAASSPRLGPAEALERQRDYDGAYNEYLVLARMYPHDVQVKVRLADVLLKLDRKQEAAEWFERVMKKCDSRDTFSLAATRLAELAERELGDVARARKGLQQYLAAFPSAPDREAMEARMASLGVVVEKRAASELESLHDAAPVAAEPDQTPAPAKRKKAALPGIEAIVTPMEESPAPVERAIEPVPSNEIPGIVALGLDRLDESAPVEEAAPKEEPRPTVSMGLDKMEDAPGRGGGSV